MTGLTFKKNDRVALCTNVGVSAVLPVRSVVRGVVYIDQPRHGYCDPPRRLRFEAATGKGIDSVFTIRPATPADDATLAEQRERQDLVSKVCSVFRNDASRWSLSRLRAVAAAMEVP